MRERFPRGKMTTIREVATKAGVSISTVSHVINETRFVSDETRSRVLAAMDELNYRPNRLAGSLRRKDKRTNTLGLLIPDSTNPFFSEVLRGAEDACFEAGFNIVLCNSDGDSEKELNYINVLLSKQVDGIMLVSAGSHQASLELISRRNAYAIMVDREVEGTQLDSVVIDNDLGGYIATQYLLELGHEEIGCITGPSLLTPSAKRVEGYRRALEDAGIPVNEQFIVPGDFRAKSGYTATKTLLDLSQRPTAIFTCNDMMAVGALCAIYESGLRVPDDISVVGFDDITLATFTVPPLTTVAQPSYEMGLLAAELMIQRLQDPSQPPQQKVLRAALVIRSSCQIRE